jgi:hypothetical protein
VRLEAVPGSAVDDQPERWVGALLCRDIRGEDGRTALHKGHRLVPDDLKTLSAAHTDELHVLWLDNGDVDEDTASERLAEAIAGSGVTRHAPVESQVRLSAATRGLLRVDSTALQKINKVDGVTVFTLPDGMPVDAGRTLAGVKITALAIPEGTLGEAISRVAGSNGEASAIKVRPFSPLGIAVVVRQQLSDSARRRFEAALLARAEWFGGQVTAIRYVSNDARDIRDALDAAAREADIILAAGVASVDPLEATWQSVLDAGGRPIRRGLPVHPGSSYWLADLDGRLVIGVASCGMLSRRSALDLLLVRRFAGEPLDADYFAGLGHGGLLGSEASWRIPAYGVALDPDAD